MPISDGGRLGLDMLGLESEEDVHAELEQIYRDRDRLHALLQKEMDEKENIVRLSNSSSLDEMIKDIQT
jgi:hypothetical protein